MEHKENLANLASGNLKHVRKRELTRRNRLKCPATSLGVCGNHGYVKFNAIQNFLTFIFFLNCTTKILSKNFFSLSNA